MGWSTGIELGPDSCVLVSARLGKGTIDISAARVLDANVWPSHDVTIISTLKQLRRSERLSRNAALIVWGLPDDSFNDEVSGPAAVRPITAAGFRVAKVYTPPQALAALARTRPRPDIGAAVAWMALNTWGAAIAIVRDGELLFARTLDWIYRPGLTESRAQLLQRYSLVAHIAPEVQRGMAIVRQQHGVNVTTAITCGDLPELRSLTMPLIEELDLEVETLDTADGLTPRGRAKNDSFNDIAPGLRLAAAVAAIAPRARVSIARPLKAVAALALGALVVWQALAFFSPRRRPPTSQPAATAPATPRPADNRVAQAPPSTSGPDTRAPVPDTRAAPAVPPAVTPPVAQTPRIETPTPPAEPRTPPAQTRPAPAVTAPPVTPRTPPPVSKPPVQAEPPRPAPVDPEPEPQPERKPAPLKDPLPHLDSILIDATRRLAIVDGQIVSVGDRVGPRVVVRIENEAIVLREPSGLEVRVSLRDAAGLPSHPLVL